MNNYRFCYSTKIFEISRTEMLVERILLLQTLCAINGGDRE